MKLTSILTLAAALYVVSADPQSSHTSAKSLESQTTTTTTIAHAKHSPIATFDDKKKSTKTKSHAKATKTKSLKASKTKAPKLVDACGLMNQQASKSDYMLTYEAVKGCFEAQKFKPDVANKVLTSVENLLGNFYAFLDQAKVSSSGAGSPFDTPVVDLMKELEKIKKKKDWKSDYEFQMALTYLTFSLNDGHLAYQNSCYKTVSFNQPISLYAPIVDGKQSVRVFYVDTTMSKKGLPKDPSSLIDCTVVTIDGEPALKAIQDFTDRTSAISKDPGVRLNDALASTSWNTDWSFSPGGFASRWILPAKSSMDYTLQCGSGANIKTQKLTVPWTIRPSDSFEVGEFKNANEYWKVQCESYTPSSPSSRENVKRDLAFPPTHAPRRGDVRIQDGGASATVPATSLFRERGTITIPTTSGPSDDRSGDSKKGSSIITQAKLVKTTSNVAFYHLLGKNSDTCVAVIASEEANFSEYDSSDYTGFIKALQTLEAQGCKKLILDMTNNGGGSVDYAYFVNQLLFPDAKPYFVEDLRDNSLTQAAAKQAMKYPKAHSVFDARGYNSAATGKPFKDATMFTKGVNQKRGGVTSTYTQRNFFPYSWSFLPLAKSKQLKFKPENMAIVTNGFCGSACTMIATRFAIVHNVKTYAIGGIAKRPLSYFSFPGGFVLQDSDIISDLNSIHLKGVKNVPTTLPIQASTSLPVGEIYALNNSTIPLEYDTQYFAAKVHLDQDPVLARHPDKVWVKIANDL
ncbi:hypothetical protein BGZ80_004987 [Entomortierella chlamydospora]|uniref:Tail specific protease domain-containing protein n=1 Tax=Entomortierella chlamydospora TaxID=101097 RepID=A0A9P6N136_9FUNG|nr:hypothetical protein BGZ79_010727 [Entomortierella chlamydospora]KAG0019969.1 hypothetical protein BGZ80_004987 [Entomortierella chlamydospora]